MSGTNTPTQIPIEVSTGSSAQQVEALTKRVQALKSALGNLVPVFNALGEDGPKALRNLLSQMNALNQVASTTSVMAGQLNAVASGAARNRRAANEYVVQQAATRRSVPAAIRSNDPNQISAVMEVLRREIDNLRLREAQLIRRRADNAEAGRPVTQIQRSLDALPRRLAEAEEKLQRLAAAAAALAEQQRVQAGVQSRIRGIAIGEAFAQTPEGRQQRLDRFNATFSRFLSGQAAREQAATESTLVGIRRNSLLGAARASAQERREAARQEERDEAAYQRLRTRSIVAAAIAGARERREAAQQEEREERNIAGIRRRTLQQQAARNGALTAATERGRTAAEAQAALYADPSMRGLLAQNQAARTMLGVEAFNSLARTPEFARLLAERSFMSGVANQQSRLRLNADPTYQRNQVQLGLQGINTRLSIREAEMANPEFQARDRNITNARSLDRLFGDGGGTLLTVQAGLLANYTVLNQLFSAFTNAATAAVQFDNALKNLQAISASTSGEMQKLQRIILDTSTQTRFSAVELTEAATQLAQAGLSVREIGQALPGASLLATATGSDLRTAVDITTTALSVFRQRADEVPRIADQMTAALNLSKLTIDQVALGFQYVGNAAADAGLSMSETTAALATLANQGIRSGSTIGTGFRQLLVDLQSPNERLAKRFRELGLSMSDVDVRSNGLVGVLNNLRNAGFTSADAFETIELRAAAAFAAFSRGASDMTALQNSINSASGAAEANAVQMQSLANRFLQLQNSINAVVTTMSSSLIAVLGNVVSGLSGAIAATEKWTTALQILGGVIGAITVGAVIGFLSRLVLSAGAAAAGVAGLTGAVSAFSVAMRAIPGVAILSAIAAGAGILYEWAGGANRAAQATENLRQRSNETNDAYNGTKEALRGLNEFIENTSRRARTLQTDQDALNAVVREAQSRFGGLTNAVNGTVSSYGQLISALRTARGELAQTLALQAQARAEAAQGAAIASEQAFQGGGNLANLISLGGRLGLRNATGARAAASEASAAVERAGGTPQEADRAAAEAAAEFITRALRNAGRSPEVAEAVRIAAGAGDRPDEATLRRIQIALTPVDGVRPLPDGVTSEQATALLAEVNRQLGLLQARNRDRTAAEQATSGAGAASFVASPSFQATASTLDDLNRIIATRRSQIESGTSLQQRQEALRAFEEEIRPLIDAVESFDTNSRSRGEREAIDASGLRDRIVNVQQVITTLRRNVAEAAGNVAVASAEAASERLTTLIEDNRRNPSRDPAVIEQRVREAEQLAAQRLEAQRRAINQRLTSGGSGATGEELSAQSQNEVSRITREYNTAVANVREELTRGFRDEVEAQLREITQQLRTATSAEPGSRGARRRGSSEEIQRLRQRAEQLIRERDRLMGRSAEATRANISGFMEQSTRAETSGVGGPEAAFIPNARVTIQQQLRNAQSELDTNLRGSRTAIEARRAQLDAARRMPTLFPQSYTNELDREINQMEVEFERNAITAREGYLQALDGIFQRARQALDDLKRLLEGSSGAERQRIEQRIEEAQGTLDSVDQARERARGDVERSRAVIAARQPGQQFTAMDGFESAGRDFQQRMGLNDSAFKFTADSMTTLFNGMQQASANFFDTMVTGSAKSSDAFKQFGVSILRTVQQIATQRLAAQLIGMAINFAFGAAGGTGTTGAVDVSSSTAASNGMMGFGRWAGYEGGLVTSRGIMRFAGGGMVPGTHVGRDTVPSLLAPGEAVLNRRAVSLVGTDAVHRMNQGMVQADQAIQPLAIRREPDNVSVYVMAPNEKPSLGPKDVLAVIGQDVLTGGSTKQLIRQVAVGAL